MNDNESEALTQVYFNVFKAYKDSEIEEAAKNYAISGEFFPPKPAHIIALVKNQDQSKHTRELVERYTCSLCKQKVSAITDGICLDCAGIPQMHCDTPKLGEPTKSNYKIEGRMRCNKCGAVRMCISEPAGSPYQCRQCYTRMTGKEIAAAFRQLTEMTG